MESWASGLPALPRTDGPRRHLAQAARWPGLFQGYGRIMGRLTRWIRRRPAATVGIAGLVAVSLVLLIVLTTLEEPGPSVEAGSGTSAAADTTDVSSATTSIVTPSIVTSTSAASTTSVVETASVPADSGIGFQPACRERDPTSGAPTSWTPWPADATLGPLGSAPSLVIGVPQQRVEFEDELQPVRTSVTAVPGGFLVVAYADTAGVMLTVVDTDGAIRWQRCLDEAPMVMASPTGEYAVLLQWEYRADGTSRSRLSTLSLAAGRPGPAVDGGLGDRTQFVTSADDGLFFIHPNPHLIDEASDRMARLDLNTLDVTDVPYPPGTNGIDAPQLLLEQNWSTGRLVQREVRDGRTAVRAVLVDGAWLTDDAVLAAEPVGYYFTGVTDGQGWFLQFRDGLGEVRWERPDIVTPGGEGFTSGLDGAVLVARGCAAPATGTCGDPEAIWSLYGLDAATGETRWERTGAWDVSVLADGKALVNEILDEPGGWSMIETETGELVADDQTWADPAAFDYECCGGGDYVHVGVQGDVVVASNYDRVAFWYPRSRSTPTAK